MNGDGLRFGGSGPNALIVRHAERHDVSSVAESLMVGLTEKGRKDAFELGRSIEGVDQLRLFHSPAVRCRETAESIAEGFLAKGGTVQGIKETWDLCAPYLLDDEVLKEADRQGYKFMRSWFNGQFDTEWIKPTPMAADMVLAPILAGLEDDEETGRLDLHVSHDWELVLLREELLDVRYEDAGWIEYLEGIRFFRQGDGFAVQNRDRSASFAFSQGRRELIRRQ
jgi:hypothetical protein